MVSSLTPKVFRPRHLRRTHHPAPGLPLAGQTHRSPITTAPTPQLHSFAHNNGPPLEWSSRSPQTPGGWEAGWSRHLQESRRATPRLRLAFPTLPAARAGPQTTAAAAVFCATPTARQNGSRSAPARTSRGPGPLLSLPITLAQNEAWKLPLRRMRRRLPLSRPPAPRSPARHFTCCPAPGGTR